MGEIMLENDVAKWEMRQLERKAARLYRAKRLREDRPGCLSRQVRRLQHQLGQQLVELGQQLQRHDPYEGDPLRP